MATKTAKKLKIYSLRYTPARGNHWQHERDTNETDVQAWLKIFRDDEPGVTFIADTRKPSNP